MVYYSLLSSPGTFKRSNGTLSHYVLLTYYGRLEVHKYRSRYMLPSASFAEKSVEAVVTTPEQLVRRHLSVRLNAMFQTIQFPASISNLHSSLSYVDGYAFTLKVLQG